MTDDATAYFDVQVPAPDETWGGDRRRRTRRVRALRERASRQPRRWVRLASASTEASRPSVKPAAVVSAILASSK